MEETGETTTKTSKRLGHRKVWIVVGCLLVLGVGGLIFYRHGHASPVPSSIQKEVSFAVYYPKLKNVRGGYRLDTNSFRIAQSDVVLFSVSYGNGRSMVFSETSKPEGDVIDKFNASAIPVHTPVNTPVGKGYIGAYGSDKNLRTLASLPITNGPWLIVTAPSDINQTELGRVLSSLTK